MNKYKVLHTADWHIGKKLLNYKRLSEQEKFLNYLIELIESEKIDLLIVAGDVYDTKKPGLDEQKLLNDFFYKLSSTCCKWCVVISGNHDKKDFLSINKKLLSKFNFFLVTEDLEDEQIVHLQENGHTKFLIFCLPYINERTLLNSNLSDINAEENDKSESALLKNLELAYEGKINNIISSFEFEHIKVPKILISHAFFNNNSNVEVLGNSYVVPTRVFGDMKFSYVALGHIHKFMKLKGNVVYSGSPIRYAFDESEKKYVNILTFNGTELVGQHAVLLPEFSKLTLLKGKFNEVRAALENIKNSEEFSHYIKIELRESISSEKEEELYESAKSNYLSLVDISYSLTTDQDELGSSNVQSISEILEQDEKYFFEEKLKQDFSAKKIGKFKMEDLIVLFEEVLNKGKSGEYENKQD